MSAISRAYLQRSNKFLTHSIKKKQKSAKLPLAASEKLVGGGGFLKIFKIDFTFFL